MKTEKQLTAVEWFIKNITENNLFNVNTGDSITNLNNMMKIEELEEQAKEIEEKNLIDMSVKSALYERKWVYEEMSDKKYKPTKVEIRDLKITALEHYNETFKSE